MGLFKPFWDTTDDKKASRAADKVRNSVTDQAELAKIAFEAPVDFVRAAAAKKIDDQGVLSKLAFDNSGLVRNVAYRRIPDDALIAEAILSDPSELNVNYAVDRITDESLLVKIALGCKLLGVPKRTPITELYSQMGVKSLNDPESALSVRLARASVQQNREKEKWNDEVCETIVFKIKNQRLLERLFIESDNEAITTYSFRKIKDPVVILDLYSRSDLSASKKRTLEILKSDKFKLL